MVNKEGFIHSGLSNRCTHNSKVMSLSLFKELIIIVSSLQRVYSVPKAGHEWVVFFVFFFHSASMLNSSIHMSNVFLIIKGGPFLKYNVVPVYCDTSGMDRLLNLQ